MHYVLVIFFMMGGQGYPISYYDVIGKDVCENKGFSSIEALSLVQEIEVVSYECYLITDRETKTL